MRSVAVICLLLLCVEGWAQSEWELAKDANQVQVYTRRDPGESLKAFRGVVKIPADAEVILKTIMDAERSVEWSARTKESRILKKDGPNHQVIYNLIETPWPVDDRDLVVEMRIERAGNLITCYLKNASGIYPAQDGIVRIPRYEGFWELRSLGNGMTQVTMQGLTDPGGTIPEWIINQGVVDTPHKTLSNLRARFVR